MRVGVPAVSGIDSGVFKAFWRLGLLEYDGFKGIDWSWLALDNAMAKAPLDGKKRVPAHKTAPKVVSNVARSLKQPAFRWRWDWRRPIATT